MSNLCNFKLHTKEEYEKYSKNSTLASFGWFVVIVSVLLSAVIVLGNSGILPNFFPTQSSSDAEKEIDTRKIALDIHAEVNKVRELHELKPLRWSDTIAEIAKIHSQDMSERNYLSHISPEGSDVADRYEKANFDCRKNLPNGDILKGGENLAQVSYPEDLTGIDVRVVQSWMDSPSHRENILFTGYDTEGIGIVVSDDILHITQNFC